jgi:hypothetical protein
MPVNIEPDSINRLGFVRRKLELLQYINLASHGLFSRPSNVEIASINQIVIHVLIHSGER